MAQPAYKYVFSFLLLASAQLWGQAPTTTTLSVSATSVRSQTAVTLTATVEAGVNPVTPGLVRFCNANATSCFGPALLGQAQLVSNGTSRISLALPVGTHSIKAEFAGTKTDSASSSSGETVTVTGTWSSSTSLTATAASPYGLTATVTGNGPQAVTGNVSFVDASNGNYPLGTAAPGTGTTTQTFVPLATTVLGSEPTTLAVGDFNGDGSPDFVLGDVNPTGDYSTIAVVLSNGNGSYNQPVLVNLPSSVFGVSALGVGDFNNDGNLDLAITSGDTNSVTILFGDGTGNLNYTGATFPTGINPNSIAVADFNRDGNADLAITNEYSSNVTILLGNGQGGFSPVSSPATDTYPYSIAAGDFNGDGIADLAVANYFGFDVTVLLGNGDGTFTAAPTPAAGVYPDSIAVGDFNGDGKQDLAVVNAYSKNITILLGDGKGDFTATAESPAAGNNPDSVTIADFNNDGIEDLAVANSNDNTVIVYYGKGDGTFPAATAQTVQLPSGTAPYSVTAFNYMANGFENFLVAGSGNNSVVLGQNTITTITNATLTRVKVPGAGTHNVQANYAGGSAYGASTSNTVGVAGTPIATTTTVTVEPSGTVAPGETVQLTAAVSPGSVGSLTPTGNMSFYNGAQFLATAPLANGIASVNFQTIAGMENILAKYAGDTNFVGSASETVTITAVTPTASTTTLAVSSNSVTKGSIVTLTATVTDIGNPVTQGLVTFCNGTAQFCEDSAVLGKAHLTNSGTATLKLALPVGNNSIKAVFGGTDDVKSSTSSAQTVTVTAPSSIATSTALTLNGTAGDYTLTAAVTGTWPPPMGNVSFVDTSNKNLVLGTKSLSAGIPAFTQSSAATGSYPASIAVADFNGDGKPDVAVANISSNSLTILLGNGGGTFTAVASPISGTPNFNNPYSIVAGDFNGDGKPDLAVANFAGDSSSLTILLGNGDGTFTVKSTPVVGIAPAAIAVGDFNGDGKLDLAVANENSNNITILLGNGDGTFTADPVSPSTAAYPYALVTADFNGDGKADLAVFGYGSNSVTILLGNGDGTFSPVSTSPATGNNPSFMAVLDFNQDGIPDLAVVNSSSNTVTILQGKGDGTFSTAFTLPTGAGPLGIVAADFNGDGTTDLAIATDNGSSLTLLLNYVNRFAPQNVPLTSGSGPLPIAVGDFNLDGSPDLVVGDINLNVAHILLNSATSSASTSGITVPGGGTHEVEAIYAGAPPYLGSISTPVAATGTPISTTVLASAPAATVGQNVAISVSISPTSAANFSVSGTVSLYNGSTLLGTMTLANAQATFSTSFAIAGTYTLTVKYGGNTNFAAGSGTVTVNVRP